MGKSRDVAKSAPERADCLVNKTTDTMYYVKTKRERECGSNTYWRGEHCRNKDRKERKYNRQGIKSVYPQALLRH